MSLDCISNSYVLGGDDKKYTLYDLNTHKTLTFGLRGYIAKFITDDEFVYTSKDFVSAVKITDDFQIEMDEISGSLRMIGEYINGMYISDNDGNIIDFPYDPAAKQRKIETTRKYVCLFDM